MSASDPSAAMETAETPAPLPLHKETTAAPAQLEKSKKTQKKKKRKANRASLQRYIYLVMKQVDPEIGISRRAMSVVNSMLQDWMQRLSATAAGLVRKGRGVTLSSREFQTAVRLDLPGEIAKHALSEGTKAVVTYTSSKN